ncbi:glycosyltransferase family 2 protein [Paenibacillus lupini]|uniref:glycosyltransferase family 2 protein n=1 Tax=Paenibacillus lupini TaxID=1450204 RepID=UPI0014210E13|nr:glycosyltransferase family 2 protein [Paenibacillus lupini]NIK26280.1 glycosyltransferase involved in cell wall biosynthesis [Paenibacillus lupini]
MRISVIIPTYMRLDSLVEGLGGLYKQERLPDEILVIARDSDRETIDYLNARLDGRLRYGMVYTPGTVEALNTGLAQATGDVIVITDDDTVPYPDWLARIEKHYEDDDKLGGLGGKDWVYHSGRLLFGQARNVGKLYWFGRMAGNHHIGVGDAREVDILKGANMSFRKKALENLSFDRMLRGSGAQVHLEIGISLLVKQSGWKLLYDPSVCVNHFPAERFDEDKRNAFNETACRNMAHNETYTILKHSGAIRRAVYLVWIALVGSPPSPGFLQFIRMVPREKGAAYRKLRSTYRGRWDGWKTWRTWINS